MEATLRPAGRADEPFLWEMLLASVFVAPGEPRPGPELLDAPQLAAYVAGFGTRPDDVGLIAVDSSGQPIGAAWARRHTPDQPGYGYVDAFTPEISIALVEAARGQGVGRRLLAALIDVVGSCSLSVDARNPAAAWYARLGFVTVGGDADHPTMRYDPPR